MDNKNVDQAASRLFARSKKPGGKPKGLIAEVKMWFRVLESMAGFLAGMGIIIIGIGLIFLLGLRETLGPAAGTLILNIGIFAFFIGMFMKILDIFLKIIGVRT
jgi:hypothetical protein